MVVLNLARYGETGGFMRRRLLCWILVLLFAFCLSTAAASAMDRFVSGTGFDDGNDCSGPTSPCATVSRAVSVAENDDTIKVAIGRYMGSVIIEALFMNMTLQGGWNADFSARLDQTSGTILDGGGGLAVLGVVATVANMELDLENLAFENGQVGVGVYNMGSTIGVRMKNCLVKNNGPSPEQASSFLQGGIGVINYGNLDLTISDCEISRNTGPMGGLFFLNLGSGTLSVSKTEIKNNVSISLGSYITALEPIQPGPRMFAGLGAGGIGIMTMEGASTEIDLQKNIFKENGGFSAGGVLFYSKGSKTRATVTNNMILKNNSVRDGGGVSVKSFIDGSTMDDTSVSLLNNTISGNSASGGDSMGGGVYEESDDAANLSNVLITNCIIWGNTAPSVGADLALVGAGAKVNASYSIIRFVRNEGGDYASNGVVGSDPLFVNRAVGDFHLSPGSPAIGTGIYGNWRKILNTWRFRKISPSDDFEGDLRADFDQRPCCEEQLGSDIGADQYVMLTGPGGQGIWSFSAEATPVRSSSHLTCKPFGLGSLASDGDYLSLQLKLPPFSESADVYIGIHAPEASPEVFLVTPAGALQPLSEDLTPWRAGSSEATDLKLFGDIPKSMLPPGTYNLYLFATSHGTLTIYNFWATSFVLE